MGQVTSVRRASEKEPATIDAALRPERLFARGGLNNFGEIAIDHGLDAHFFHFPLAELALPAHALRNARSIARGASSGSSRS